jgi:RND superfamily putative drug exporter
VIFGFSDPCGTVNAGIRIWKLGYMRKKYQVSIISAALVLAVSFFAFASSGVSIMKMLGLGIAFAVILDATVIRALLVPALMRLFGNANWYAPKWMKWVQKKIGLEH